MRYSGVSLYLTCLLPFFLFQVHLYQLLDVYLLGDIFTDFRKDSLEVFQLEVRFVFERDAWLLYLSLLYLHFCSFFYQPCCYSTLPALAMDAVLKQTNVSIQLVSDPNLHLFFEDHLRGMDGTMVQKF